MYPCMLHQSKSSWFLLPLTRTYSTDIAFPFHFARVHHHQTPERKKKYSFRGQGKKRNMQKNPIGLITHVCSFIRPVIIMTCFMHFKFLRHACMHVIKRVHTTMLSSFPFQNEIHLIRMRLGINLMTKCA